jgi:hypothetical protein
MRAKIKPRTFAKIPLVRCASLRPVRGLRSTWTNPTDAKQRIPYRNLAVVNEKTTKTVKKVKYTVCGFTYPPVKDGSGDLEDERYVIKARAFSAIFCVRVL